MPSQNPKNQHYVQRAYLEGFQDPRLETTGKPSLWVYIPGKSPFSQRPERVAVRNYYYCHREEEKRIFDAEHQIQKLEDISLPALLRLRHKQFDFSPTERLTIAGYISLSHVRVPSFERSIDRLTSILTAKRIEFIGRNDIALKQVVEKLNAESGENTTVEEFRKGLTGGNVILTQTNRGWSLNQMFRMLLYLQAVIADMKWTFLTAPDGDEGFLTTDNPVAMFDPTAQFGVAFASTRSAYFTYPISREVCLRAGHEPAPKSMVITSAHVRAINKAGILKADSQVYSPFKAREIQRIVDSLIGGRPPRTRVMMKKGRVVEE